MKVYIASPFFNKEEDDVVEGIKALLKGLGIEYFSPKDELRYRKTDPPEVARECFMGNIKAMNTCDVMIANVEDLDPGTLFEMGYFFSINKKLLAFSMNKSRKLNLMLSQSCIGFAKGYSDLLIKIHKIKEGTFEKETYNGEQE